MIPVLDIYTTPCIFQSYLHSICLSILNSIRWWLKQPKKIYNHNQISLSTINLTAVPAFINNLWYLTVLRRYRLNFKLSFLPSQKYYVAFYCTCILKLRYTYIKPLEGKSFDLHLTSSPLPKHCQERLQHSVFLLRYSTFQILFTRTNPIENICKDV